MLAYETINNMEQKCDQLNQINMLTISQPTRLKQMSQGRQWRLTRLLGTEFPCQATSMAHSYKAGTVGNASGWCDMILFNQ